MPSPITTPGYRYATRRYVGDGVTVDFEFQFDGTDYGYISRDHVEVWILDNDNRVEVQLPPSSITWFGPNQIRIPEPQPTNKTVIIRRNTPKEQPMLDFTDGAILNENNLNMTSEQAVYCAAEMVDYFADLMDMFRGVNADVIDSLNFALQALAIAQQAREFALQALAIAQDADNKATQAMADALEALTQSNAAIASANAALAAALSAEEAAIQAANDAELARLAAQAAEEAVADILAASKRMEVALYVYGRMQFSNEEVIRYLSARPFVIDLGLSSAVLQVAPLSTFILNIFKNGVVVGTITFMSAQLTGTVNIPEEVIFNTGDILSLSTIDGDSQASGLSTTFAGVRL